VNLSLLFLKYNWTFWTGVTDSTNILRHNLTRDVIWKLFLNNLRVIGKNTFKYFYFFGVNDRLHLNNILEKVTEITVLKKLPIVLFSSVDFIFVFIFILPAFEIFPPVGSKHNTTYLFSMSFSLQQEVFRSRFIKNVAGWRRLQTSIMVRLDRFIWNIFVDFVLLL
jgi:hypothetical protein